MGDAPPKLCVGVTTYNHVRFIRQALESILSQKTSFPFEIVVHDDCSNDGTREIVEELVQAYPDKVRAILQTENQFSQGRRIIQILLAEMRGEYFALLDGDDYWQSERKLQTQADFLDRHPDCAMCQPKTVYYSETKRRAVLIFPPPNRRSGRFTCADLAEGNFIQTSAVMFRSAAVPVLPLEFGKLKFGDYPLFGLIAQSGWIGFIDEEMVTYRIHSGNFWLSKPTAERVEATTEVRRFLAEHIDPQYRQAWVDALNTTQRYPSRVVRGLWSRLREKAELVLR